MRLIELKSNDNGGHDNQTIFGSVSIPDGWAVIPEDMETPNFPFGEVTAKKIDGIMTVTKWVATDIPKLEDTTQMPSKLEQLRADVDYLAIITGVTL